MTTSTTTSTEPERAGPPSKRRRQRLFFALWPAPAVAERLAALVEACHASCGGRPMRRETLHLTLAFVGEVDIERLPALRAAATALFADMAPPTAFSLCLDRCGYWPHNHILWAGSSAAVAAETPAVTQLAERLAAALQAAGFALEARPFLPHVTLLRDARPVEPPPMPAVHWPVHDFVLVRSDLSAGRAAYETIERWPLGRR